MQRYSKAAVINIYQNVKLKVTKKVMTNLRMKDDEKNWRGNSSHPSNQVGWIIVI